MNGRSNRFGWAWLLFAVVFGIATAVIAYNAGVSHGLASVGADAGARVGRYYRPWGFGFAFPLLFFAFFFLVFARCGRPWMGYWGPRGNAYMHDPRWVPPPFEEWHRRAHDAMKEQPSADDPGRRG